MGYRSVKRRNSSWRRWHDRLIGYTGNLRSHYSKIHLSITGSAKGILCHQRKRGGEVHTNYVDQKTFDEMQNDPHVPGYYLCHNCERKARKEDWDNPSAEVQLILLSETDL